MEYDQIDKKKEHKGIDILNEDELAHIFSYLSIKDRLTCEGVSRFWKLTILDSWCFFKKLDLSNATWGLQPKKNGRRLPIIKTCSINQVLRRCGKYLTAIDFMPLRTRYNMMHYYSVFSEKHNDDSCNCVLMAIANNCINLKYLNVAICCVKGFKSVASKCGILNELHLTSYCRDENLNSVTNLLILNNIKTLSSISLNSFPLTEMLFSKMLHPLRRIRLDFCYDYNNEGEKCIKTIMENTPFLEEVKVHGTSLNATDFIKMIARKDLSVLDLTSFYCVEVEKNFTNLFSKLRNLKTLRLDYVASLNGSCLSKLQFKNLYELHLKYCTNFDPKNLNCLKFFNNLRILSLHQIKNAQFYLSNNVSYCSNLLQLEIVDVECSLRTTCGQHLITHLKKLKELTIHEYQRGIIVNGVSTRENVNYFNSKDLLTNIGNHLEDLVKLSLSLRNLEDINLSCLQSNKNLKCLDLNYIPNITGTGLKNNLEILSCIGCKNLNTYNLVHFTKTAKDLQLLNIYACENVDCQKLEQASYNCNKCDRNQKFFLSHNR